MSIAGIDFVREGRDADIYWISKEILTKKDIEALAKGILKTEFCIANYAEDGRAVLVGKSIEGDTQHPDGEVQTGNNYRHYLRSVTNICFTHGLYTDEDED